MTLAHICIIGAFILVGSLGLAGLQQACADCFRHVMGQRKTGLQNTRKTAGVSYARTRLT